VHAFFECHWLCRCCASGPGPCGLTNYEASSTSYCECKVKYSRRAPQIRSSSIRALAKPVAPTVAAAIRGRLT
jgi:hypothetical protein